MREASCGDCKSWEEELYWTHFQYIHFSLFLHAGFDQHLAIPEKFTRNLRSKLPDTVTLKGPAGTAWEVCLTEHENTLLFGDGWQEFVKVHSLEENDILVFKYNGESCFNVLMFDGQSMCEKTGSYFLTKCDHKEHKTTGCQTKSSGESSTEVLSASPDMAKNVEASAVDVEEKAEIVRPSRGLSSRTSKQLKSRMHVLKSAKAAVTSNGFVAVMKPAHVSKQFFMTVPRAWVSKHITYEDNQCVILRIKDKTWQIRLYYRKQPIRGGFAGEWKNFVLDNNIKEFDVCVFEPCIPLDSVIVLDVNIFRVSQET